MDNRSYASPRGGSIPECHCSSSAWASQNHLPHLVQCTVADRCRPNRRVRRSDTTATGPRSRLFLLQSTRHTWCRHSMRFRPHGGAMRALLGNCVNRSGLGPSQYLHRAPLEILVWPPGHTSRALSSSIRCSICGFRHHRVSPLVMAGTSIEVIEKWSGHGSEEMIRRYAHLRPDFMQSELEKVITCLNSARKLLSLTQLTLRS